jgi:hypothetical protein
MIGLQHFWTSRRPTERTLLNTSRSSPRTDSPGLQETTTPWSSPRQVEGFRQNQKGLCPGEQCHSTTSTGRAQQREATMASLLTCLGVREAGPSSLRRVLRTYRFLGGKVIFDAGPNIACSDPAISATALPASVARFQVSFVLRQTPSRSIAGQCLGMLPTPEMLSQDGVILELNQLQKARI